MLNAAIAFFLIALLAMFLGQSGIAGFSMEAGRLLLIVFLVLAVISFLASLFRGKKPALSVLLALGLSSLGFPSPSVAETTTGEKIENQATETKNDIKRNWRKMKRHARNKTGNHSTKEDLKDGMKNAGDKIDETAKSTENKVD